MLFAGMTTRPTREPKIFETTAPAPIPAWLTARRALTGLAILLTPLFLALVWVALRRSIWIDEAMALMNYPLPVVSLFDPLPRYDQAAPPLFNAISDMLWPLPIWAQRLALFVAVASSFLAAMRPAYGWAVALLTLLLTGLILQHWIPIASELKYYGLDMAGCALILGWASRNADRETLRPRDLIGLTLMALLGIGSLVFSLAALGAVFLQRAWSAGGLRFQRLAPTRKELPFLVAFAIVLVGYALLIRHGTRIQIATYPDVYALEGFVGLRVFFTTCVNFGGKAALLIGVFCAGLAALSLAQPRTRAVGLAVLAVAALFAALALLGLYPASAPRHVAWLGAIFAFVLAEGIVACGRLTHIRWRAGLVAMAALGLTCCWGIAKVAGLLRSPDPFSKVGNDALMNWLVHQPVQDIGLWHGSQPIVEVYSRTTPALAKHRFFGQVDTRSAFPMAETIGGPDVATAEAIAQRIETQRTEPGAWGRQSFYRRLGDHSAPARTLVAAAPRGRAFLIVTQLDLTAQDQWSRAGNQALFSALSAQSCAHGPVLQVKNAYVLRVLCR